MKFQKRALALACATLLSASLLVPGAQAALTHTVVRGDTMWKLAVRYEVGTSEIITANPQVATAHAQRPANHRPQRFCRVLWKLRRPGFSLLGLPSVDGSAPLTAWE